MFDVSHENTSDYLFVFIRFLYNSCSTTDYGVTSPMFWLLFTHTQRTCITFLLFLHLDLLDLVELVA